MTWTLFQKSTMPILVVNSVTAESIGWFQDRDVARRVMDALNAITTGQTLAYQNEHVFLKHRPFDCISPDCPICEGGLLLCVRCGDAEGELGETCRGYQDGPAPSQLDRLMQEAYATAKAHGFWDPPVPEHGTKLMLMVSEVAEVFEELRDNRAMEAIYRRTITDEAGCQHEHEKPEGVPIELADIVIRILDFCAAYNVPLERALREKMDYNQSRPFKHGGKSC